ncbi:MAG: hypothetical protein WC365_03140 [Candidatus Babeliales bacterium]|jgi:hypothetical protein
MESVFWKEILSLCLIFQCSALSAMKHESSDYYEDPQVLLATDDYVMLQPPVEKAKLWNKYFFEALDHGPVELVKTLLGFHGNFAQEYKLLPIVDLYDLYGRTALIIATMSGSLEKVKLIIGSINIFELKHYINKPDAGGWSAVVYADHLKFHDILAELRSKEEISNAHMNIRIQHVLQTAVDEGRSAQKKNSPKGLQVLETIFEEEKESEE